MAALHAAYCGELDKYLLEERGLSTYGQKHTAYPSSLSHTSLGTGLGSGHIMMAEQSIWLCFGSAKGGCYSDVEVLDVVM
jgi:hypothetical protein